MRKEYTPFLFQNLISWFRSDTIWAHWEATQSSTHVAKCTTFTGSKTEMTSQQQSLHPFPVMKQSGSIQNWFKPDLSIRSMLLWHQMRFWIGMSRHLWISRPMLSTWSWKLPYSVCLWARCWSYPGLFNLKCRVVPPKVFWGSKCYPK